MNNKRAVSTGGFETKGITVGAVINEIYPDDGFNTGEWVEIYNADQNLNGWELVQWTGVQWYVIFAFTSDPGLGYITINQTSNWSIAGKINESMTIALRNNIGVIVDNVTIPSIADDSSYARYRDNDDFPLDSASGEGKNPADWYEELAGTTTKGTMNTTKIPEFSNLFLPIFICILFFAFFKKKKIWNIEI